MAVCTAGIESAVPLLTQLADDLVTANQLPDQAAASFVTGAVGGIGGFRRGNGRVFGETGGGAGCSRRSGRSDGAGLCEPARRPVATRAAPDRGNSLGAGCTHGLGGRALRFGNDRRAAFLEPVKARLFGMPPLASWPAAETGVGTALSHGDSWRGRAGCLAWACGGFPLARLPVSDIDA